MKKFLSLLLITPIVLLTGNFVYHAIDNIKIELPTPN